MRRLRALWLVLWMVGSPAALAADTPPEPSPSTDLKSIEGEVNALKDKVFRAKARLMQLNERVLAGSGAGARVVLTVGNALGPTFLVESVSAFFDGTNVFEKSDPTGASFSPKTDVKVYEGAIPPGNHNVTVTMVVRGNGSGAFPYLKDYSFKGQNSFAFVAEDAQTAAVRMTVQKKGGALAGFEDGPEIKFDLAQTRNAAAGGSAD